MFYSYILFFIFYIKVTDYLILMQCKDTNNVENTKIYFHKIYENTQIHIAKSFENTQIWMFFLFVIYFTTKISEISDMAKSYVTRDIV